MAPILGRTSLVALTAAVVIALLAPVAIGQTEDAADSAPTPDRDRCIASFESAQPERSAGHLIEARRLLAECSAEACPDFVRDKCIGWYQEVNGTIPSLVVSATGPDGADRSGVKVTLDGEVVAERLDGQPIELDPGEHRLLLEMAGHPSRELRILAKAGERQRLLEVPFVAAAAAAPDTGPAPDRPKAVEPDERSSETMDDGPSPLFWVALGVGGVGLVVGGVTGAMALSQGSDLKDRCAAGGCDQQNSGDDLAAANTVADVSTVSFVAGGVLAAVGLVGLIVQSGDDGGQGARIEPLLGPGIAGVRGSF